MQEYIIMKGILGRCPYPIAFADDAYVIRQMNRYAKYHDEQSAAAKIS